MIKEFRQPIFHRCPRCGSDRTSMIGYWRTETNQRQWWHPDGTDATCEIECSDCGIIYAYWPRWIPFGMPPRPPRQLTLFQGVGS